MAAPREFDLCLPDLPLTNGGVVTQHRAHGWSWGPEGAPVVLLVHALTGSARADEWWGPMVGPGRPLDPTRFRLLCFNNLGGCYGSSGPGQPGYPDGARLDTRDQARALWLALDALGVDELHLAAGGSLGGMIVLALAAERPHAVERLLPLCTSAEASAWVIGFNHVQRQILALDPTRGLEVARQLAMLTYRAEPGLEARQSRHLAPEPDARGRYRVEGYLEHQGASLRRRFDARSYLAMLDAMDSHDVTADLGAYPGWALVVDVDSDVLFPSAQSDALAGLLRRAERRTISSQHGHDGFLLEWAALAPLLERALSPSPGAHAVTPWWNEVSP